MKYRHATGGIFTSAKLSGALLLSLVCGGAAQLFGQQLSASKNGEAVTASQPISLETLASYPLGPSDQLKIWVLGMEQEIGDKPIRVDPAGDIDLPLIGRVHAGGLTTDQLKADLVMRYAKDLRNPQISVELLDFGSEPVSVMGAVNRPGVRQLEGHKTLVEAISLAEGLRPDAGPRVNISRQIRYGQIPLPGASSTKPGSTAWRTLE